MCEFYLFFFLLFSVDSNVENSQTEENNSTSVCDGNQNLNSSAVLAATTDAKLLKKSIKMLKTSFVDLMKAYNRTNVDQNETKSSEQGKEEDAGEEVNTFLNHQI